MCLNGTACKFVGGIRQSGFPLVLGEPKRNPRNNCFDDSELVQLCNIYANNMCHSNHLAFATFALHLYSSPVCRNTTAYRASIFWFSRGLVLILKTSSVRHSETTGDRKCQQKGIPILASDSSTKDQPSLGPHMKLSPKQKAQVARYAMESKNKQAIVRHSSSGVSISRKVL